MTNVNLGSTINWTSQPGATSYEIASQNLPNGDPHLPDAVDVGNVLSAPLSQFLPNAVIGASYQLFVRAKAGVYFGPWGQLDVTVITQFSAPVLTVS